MRRRRDVECAAEGVTPHVLYALNAGLRFLLEIASLIALGRVGYASASGALGYALAAALPLMAASAWGVFTVPGDPSRGKTGPVPVSGRVRLLLEALCFAAGAAAFWRTGDERVAIVFGAGVLFHYACGHARTRWLLRGATGSPPRA